MLAVFTDQAYGLILLAESAAVVTAWAEALVSTSLGIMRLGRNAILCEQAMAFVGALEFRRSQLVLAFLTDTIEEGVQAWSRKREPVWAGR